MRRYIMKRLILNSSKLCRIARTDEFDNGRVLHNWERMDTDKAEELAKEYSLNNRNKIFYVQYDDIMNPSSGLYWVGGNSYTSYQEALQASRGN